MLNRREAIIAGVTGAIGLASGIAFMTRPVGGPAQCKLADTPLEEFMHYLCAFHVAKDNPKDQVIAHHYCMALSDDVFQCIVFDSKKKDAKVLGVEYVISRKLYDKLLPEEKPMWHPHTYEVDAGLLVAPKVSGYEEQQLMEKLKGTYGKTFHTWPDAKSSLPVGIPKLEWAFTQDGQIDKNLIRKRDADININTDSIRQKREWRKKQSQLRIW